MGRCYTHAIGYTHEKRIKQAERKIFATLLTYTLKGYRFKPFTAFLFKYHYK